MKTTEFNLLDEKWILVRKNDCTVTELSVTDVLLHAHEFKELAGELPTQDISILRLLLAILQTVFSRYTVSGERQDIADEDDAIDRWKELWDAGRFPEKPIREYLAQWHDRFWLFHPERPFYQTNAASTEKTAAWFPAAKLNSAISESNHKPRLFSSRAGEQKSNLTYAEVARWLVHINSFDDSSNERGKQMKTHIGVAWLGNLGVISARGKNLFEDLMLNLVMCDANYEFQGAEKPCWENEEQSDEPRTEICQPNCLSRLYTLQSRRISLHSENGVVTGCYIYGGDFFSKEDALTEPMTLWRVAKKEKNLDRCPILPKQHINSNYMWREFSSCFCDSKETPRPGIVRWIEYLREKDCIAANMLVSFRICGVRYDTMKSCYENIFSDSLTFHTDLLTDLGRRWQNTITNEVSQCDELAKLLSSLARSLEIASGSSRETAGKSFPVQNIREQFYFSVDVPFREWLLSIDPHWEIGSDEEFECVQHWHDTVKTIASRLADELVKEAGSAAIIGHMVKERDKPDEYYSAPKALNIFKANLNKLYPKEEHNA